MALTSTPEHAPPCGGWSDEDPVFLVRSMSGGIHVVRKSAAAQTIQNFGEVSLEECAHTRDLLDARISSAARRNASDPMKWSCGSCGSTDGVWCCVACGHVACSSHAPAHVGADGHELAVEVNSRICRCFVCGGGGLEEDFAQVWRNSLFILNLTAAADVPNAHLRRAADAFANRKERQVCYRVRPQRSRARPPRICGVGANSARKAKRRGGDVHLHPGAARAKKFGKYLLR